MAIITYPEPPGKRGRLDPSFSARRRQDATMKLERATAPFITVDAIALPGAGGAADVAEASRTAAELRGGAARTAMLSGPILSTLLNLALPTMAVLLAQTAVN